MEYLSTDGAALGCIRAPEGACLQPQEFDVGGEPLTGLAFNGQEQASAIAATLSAAAANPSIRALYLRGFNPFIQLQDLSASVHGKPAQWLLPIWYDEINRP